jgi:hypothetical protein
MTWNGFGSVVFHCFARWNKSQFATVQLFHVGRT